MHISRLINIEDLVVPGTDSCKNQINSKCVTVWENCILARGEFAVTKYWIRPFPGTEEIIIIYDSKMKSWM